MIRKCASASGVFCFAFLFLPVVVFARAIQKRGSTHYLMLSVGVLGGGGTTILDLITGVETIGMLFEILYEFTIHGCSLSAHMLCVLFCPVSVFYCLRPFCVC